MNARQPSMAAADSDLVAARINATIREEIRALSAYPVAQAAGMIKLDAMENPHRLPEALQGFCEIVGAAACEGVRTYLAARGLHRVQELAQGRAAAPAGHAGRTRCFGIVELADEGGHDVGGLEVVVVVAPVNVGGHDRARSR